MSLLKYGLSTTALHGVSLEQKFELTKKMGFDGIEIMITHDTDSHSYEVLKDLSVKHKLPILSIHAPTLIALHFVWGTKPYPKLARAAEHAALTGATTVVVHPPYRWQKDYSKMFLEAVRHVNNNSGVHIAVENMYPWYLAGKEVPAYAPKWETIREDAGADSLTFDFSHATVSGIDIVSESARIASRLRHIHISDAKLGSKHDAHLPVGNGDLPIRETFQVLKEQNWNGAVVAEINTLKQLSLKQQLKVLQQSHDNARELMY